MARKPADKVGIIVRFTEALRRRIERGAKANHRSMNSEIVARLEAVYHEEGRRERMEAARKGAADRTIERLLTLRRERPALFNPPPDQREAAAQELVRELDRALSEEYGIIPRSDNEEEKKK
jgi:Arc-like DNA binding domain